MCRHTSEFVADISPREQCRLWLTTILELSQRAFVSLRSQLGPRLFAGKWLRLGLCLGTALRASFDQLAKTIWAALVQLSDSARNDDAKRAIASPSNWRAGLTITILNESERFRFESVMPAAYLEPRG
jgi:hypothetical protein